MDKNDKHYFPRLLGLFLPLPHRLFFPPSLFPPLTPTRLFLPLLVCFFLLLYLLLSRTLLSLGISSWFFLYTFIPLLVVVLLRVRFRFLVVIVSSLAVWLIGLLLVRLSSFVAVCCSLYLYRKTDLNEF